MPRFDDERPDRESVTRGASAAQTTTLGNSQQKPCPFCAPLVKDETVLDEHGTCFVVGSKGYSSLLVIPRAHRTSPFELTESEWTDLRTLLARSRELIAETPDGWNVGWNVGRVGGQELEHVHCHLIPRYADEPYAGRGLRWWFKQPENSRPGSGRS
jgi:diadenosine tetraphosphate (Ap4A) HIT family hydrolase